MNGTGLVFLVYMGFLIGKYWADWWAGRIDPREEGYFAGYDQGYDDGRAGKDTRW